MKPVDDYDDDAGGDEHGHLARWCQPYTKQKFILICQIYGHTWNTSTSPCWITFEQIVMVIVIL